MVVKLRYIIRAIVRRIYCQVIDSRRFYYQNVGTKINLIHFFEAVFISVHHPFFDYLITLVCKAVLSKCFVFCETVMLVSKINYVLHNTTP